MIFGDYHTHTTYSDGRGSVADNAISAKAKGLVEIAITDHGFNITRHGFEKYLCAVQDCKSAQEIYGIKVKAGVEANLISLDGELDVTQEQLPSLQYLIFGFHKFAKPKDLKSFFKMYFITFFNGLIPTSKKAKARNTRAMINAINKYPVQVLTHINHSLKVDVQEVAKACANKGVLIEINAKHLKDLKRIMTELVQSEVKFVLNSDAHKPQDVGALDKALEFALANEVTKERITNYRED